MLHSCTIFAFGEKGQIWLITTSSQQMQWGKFESFFLTFIDNIYCANTAAAFSWNGVKHFLVCFIHCLSNILESGN